MAKEENILELKGKVSDLLPNAMFRVLLENGLAPKASPLAPSAERAGYGGSKYVL